MRSSKTEFGDHNIPVTIGATAIGITKIDENTLLARFPELVINKARNIPTINSKKTEPKTSNSVTWIAFQKIESERSAI